MTAWQEKSGGLTCFKDWPTQEFHCESDTKNASSAVASMNTLEIINWVTLFVSSLFVLQEQPRRNLLA